MKNFKSKISTLLIIMLVILGTIGTCNVLAEELEQKLNENLIVESNHTHTYANGDYIPYSNLNDYYDVFCCQRGTNLPDYERTEVANWPWKESDNYISGKKENGTGKYFPYLTENDKGMQILRQKSTTGSPFTNRPYQNKTYGNYKIIATKIATPKEAYILSEMIKVDGMGEYNYAQYAWWTTQAGSHGNNTAENAFAKEADAFEAYILQVAGVTSTSDLKYKTAKVVTEQGEKEYENAFDFEYKPEWVKDGEYENPTVTWDAEIDKYTIGPFAINYVGSAEQFGNRGEVQFAGIEDMEIYTDASSKPLELGKDWEFVWVDGERTLETESKFPLANEKFYIRLNYVDEVTKITNIKTKFKYMNACGVYQDLQGTYFIATWKQQSKDYYKPLASSYNGIYNVYDYTEYWLQLVSLKETTSQRLALGINAARWYEHTEIDRDLGLRSKKIIIEKDVVDEKGESVEVNKFFNFKVTVDGAENAGTDIVRVKAGKAAESRVYYWYEENGTPTYKVEEIPTDGYKLVSIQNAVGTFDGNTSIKVLATNTLDEHNGNLKIVKKINEKVVNGKKSNLEGKTFLFEVVLSGSFKHNEVMYKDESLIVQASITIQNGIGFWELGNVTWYGDTAPTYTVKELKSKDAELISIMPDTGSLVDGEYVTVTAINEQIVDKAKIHIIKTLDIGNNRLDENKIMNLKFSFNIDVDGYERQKVVLTAKREENRYVWEYTSGDYLWFHGQEPEYTITEVDLPAGTIFVSAESDVEGTEKVERGIKGKLVSDEAKNFLVTNEFVNKFYYRDDTERHARIKLTKKIEENVGLDNKDYKFVITVSGTFKYRGIDYKDTTIQLTTDQDVPNGAIEIEDNKTYDNTHFVVIKVGESETEATWASEEFSWYGPNAPEFTAEENLIGENIISSVQPPKGYLNDSETADLNVVAWNRLNADSGYIHIEKTLENAEKCSPEYIKSLVFKFKLSVDTYEPQIIELYPERINNDDGTVKYVWQYTSEAFNWKKGEEPLHYTLEEIDIPEGTEFVSASADGGTVSGRTISGQLKKSTTGEILITTNNSFINKAKENVGDLTIDKRVTHGSLNGKEFKFNVTFEGTFEYEGVTYGSNENSKLELRDVVVKGGSKWTSSQIKWYGEVAPRYTVEEQESEIANNISVLNASGTVKPGANATVAVFENESKLTGGYLKITKQIENGVQSNDKFTFRVTVDGYEPFIVTIEANETYTSDMFKWEPGKEAPSYKVEEIGIPAGSSLVRIDNSEGKLQSGTTVNVVAINKLEEHEDIFKVTKEVTCEEKLLDGLDMPKFDITITISGTFEMDGESIVNSKKVIKTSIEAGKTYTSPLIKWWGTNAPTVTVIEDNVPKGWINVGISNNGAEIKDNLEIVVTNELKVVTIIDLTFKLAGDVWEDVPQDPTSKNTPDSVPNGLIDESEIGLGGVEVYIYKSGGELAQIYDDGVEISQPIITSDDGHWEAPNVKVLPSGETYDVEFVYDGQTYEPTKFLATSNGDANSFRSASTSGRDAWAKDSMAKDFNRAEVNSRIEQVKGYTPINGNGSTTGMVDGSEGEQIIYYESSSGGFGSLRKVSKVVTTNEDGTVKDLFKAKARTSEGGLTFPFDKKMHIENIDTYISELGLVNYYMYSAVYDYVLHINLGLVKRPEADLGATKDLDSAKVTVKDTILNYKFNTLEDIGSDCYSRQVYADTNKIEYQLGLYTTDYYYRAEIYQVSDNREGYNALASFYTDLGTTLKSTELDVYLKYKLSLYNESGSYITKINAVDDYFNSALGTPISEEIKKYNEETQELETVANKSYIESGKGTRADVDWQITEKGIKGSDGVTYNKMTADLSNLDIKLASGERAIIYVTFAVQKDSINGVQNAIALGNKSNIVEIANYSTYYQDGTTLAGKIDTDSAPANVNIRSHNEKEWYEDDTDSAPVLKLQLLQDTRRINGIAWEDSAKDSTTAIGNGLYDEGEEALIGGLTTELIEKVTINDKEYDFLLPTYKGLDSLGGKTIESLTGLDTIIETARGSRDIVNEKGETVDTIGVGGYSFEGVPVGNFVVRFVYGNNKLDLEDTEGITGDPVALKADGTVFSGKDKILTANYDDDREGATGAVYNGQDYKTTIYQAGFIPAGSYVTNEWHDLKNASLEQAKVSDSRDSETRRLEVISNSEVVTNLNSNVLATANDFEGSHKELYDDYYMFADTAKLKLNIEDDAEGVETREKQGTVIENGVVRFDMKETEYIVNNIDCGLIERAENAVVLDKEISSIRLKTNDGRVIFNALYDINYETVDAGILTDLSDKVIVAKMDDKYLVANVSLNESSIATDQMQAIDKNENKLPSNEENTGTQNFRFINIDTEILQGTTIEIDYLISALNIGEVDYTGTELSNIFEANETDTVKRTKILDLAVAAEADTEVKLGQYLGTTYYTGDGTDDVIVSTRVRQVVDYVDNDGIFSPEYNLEPNHSWKNTTITELTGSGYASDRLLEKVITTENELLDPKDVSYVTSQRNNLALSIDTQVLADGQTQLHNSGFEANLVPHVEDENAYKSDIKITVTRTVSAQDDAKNLTYDNISEIVKFENSVGRRDVLAVTGNANPKLGEFKVSINERDSSATELVTFTPPTGIEAEKIMSLQTLIVIVAALSIVVVGIVIIKKTVLK